MNIPVEIAHREMYWHITSPYKYFIYPLMVVAIAIFAFGIYKKVDFWRKGRPDKARFGDWGKRIKYLLWEIPFQTKVLKDRVGGIIHVVIFWSFMLLTMTTAVVFIDVDFGVPVYNGAVYLFLTILADIAGLALLVGVAAAAIRRYIQKPERLDNKWDDAFILAVLAAAGVTGFLLEGIRIAHTNDQWAAWSPVGYLVSLAVGGMSETAAKRVFQTTWWAHFAVTFAFFAAMPYTKFFHILTLPANVFFTSLKPKGALDRVDIEKLMEDEAAAENFNVGVTAIKDLTWKQRMDYDACLRCGRCQDVCPSHRNEHPLSPKKFVNDMKAFCEKNKDLVVAEGAEAPALVGGAIDSDTLWECRTCRACMDACPAHIEHVPQIMELRRAEVMMRGQLPQDAAIALKQMEKTGNPFGPQHERSDWIRREKIPVIAPGGECEVLFWIGCCTTFDPIKQKVAMNVLSILKAAGVAVGVLGEDETCCGDPARVFGDENLFQTTAKMQIENIQSRKFKYLVCHCPHCFNVMKNEYPQFGADFNVVHHTELIYNLLKEGRIKLDTPIKEKITYHDPCYLGRYNDIYDQPREIIKAIPGAALVEMKHNREKSQCCGGGGGHYWMDIDFGKRFNVTRIEEANDTRASIVATSCIFCLQMLVDAIKIGNLDERLRAEDISELVLMAMGRKVDAAKEKQIEEIAA